MNTEDKAVTVPLKARSNSKNQNIVSSHNRTPSLPPFHMDLQYPELFRSREASADFSVLNPCARLPHRLSRVRDLSLTSLGPPSSSELHSRLGVPHCPAIHAPFFYQAFNSYSRDLYEFRTANKISIRTPPILFDLSGHLVSEKKLRRFARKGPLFGKMPSSCQDIRTSNYLHF